MIRKFFARVRRMARDIYLHLGPGMLCQLRGKHRDLRQIGTFQTVKRGGYRPAALQQCAKCCAIMIPERDVRRVGGRDA
jgi:hypothetical protein